MDKLRFLHIPKTAGSTFSRILKNQYKGKAWFVFKGNIIPDKERYSELSDDEKQSIMLFLGHAPLHSGVKEADEVPVITILRDPVRRVKSFCQHVSEGKSLYLRDSFPPETFDLDEFLWSNNSELFNLQSRMLINNEKRNSELLTSLLTPEETCAKAVDNLFNKVTCFGLQEYFDESLVLFADKLGWKTPYYEYINRKNPKQLLKFEDRHIQRIAELNAVDIELYRVAKERFCRTIESEERYKRKFEKFRHSQKLASPMLKVYGETGRYLKRKYRAITGGK